MNKDSIYAVSPRRTVKLLQSMRFECVGKPEIILSDAELRAKPVLHSSAYTVEDQLDKLEYIGRNIDEITEIVHAHGTEAIDLVNYNQAELIYYCIDHFLVSQHGLNYGKATEEQLEDYGKLEVIANLMLEKMVYLDRSTLPNVITPPKPRNVEKPTVNQLQLKYNNIFKVKQDIRPENPTPLPEGVEEIRPDETPKYKSPFKRKVSAGYPNTLNRFGK